MSPFLIKFLIYGGVALAISAGATAAVVTYKSAIVRAERAENDLRNAKAELAAAETARLESEKQKKRLQEMLDEADRLAKEAKEREEEERKRNAQIATALERLAKENKAVREWADTPVPDAVRRLRRDPGTDSQNGIRPSEPLRDPDKPAVANPRTSAFGQDEWRFGSGEPRELVRPAVLQFGQNPCEATYRKDEETMKTQAMILAALMVGAAFQVEAQDKPVQPVVLQAQETNYYDFLKESVGQGADPETRRLAIFAGTIAHVTGQRPQNGAAPNAQQPQVVQVRQGRTFWDVLYDGTSAVFDRTFTAAERIAPAALSYAGQRHQTKASVQMAEINSQVAIEQGRNFVAVAQSGFNATQQTAAAGFNAITSLPTATSYSVNGNANFGPGNFAVTTNTNSGNTTRTCTSGTAGNSGGATGGPGGTSGSPSC